MFQLAVYSDHTGFLPPKQARKIYKKAATKAPAKTPANTRSPNQKQTYSVQNARRRDLFDDDGEECFFCSIEEFCASFWMVFVALIIFIVTFTMMYSESDVDTDFGAPVFTTRSTHRHYDAEEDRKFHQNLSCESQKNFVFLSHNRTGSLMLTNILQQFGYNRKLKFAIPTIQGDRCVKHFNLSSTDTSKLKYNIICHPTKFDHKLFSNLVPEDAKYFTMLRNPLNTRGATHDLVFNVSAESIQLKEKCSSYTLKGKEMMYNFGFDSLEVESDDQIKAVIDWVEKKFGLVMIEEHFDESLLLLKKYMCWSLNDILYLTMKHNLTTQESPPKLDESMLNTPDYHLYRHFNQTLWKQISKYGSSYQRDYNELQLAKLALRNTCQPRLEAFRQKRELHPLLKSKSRLLQRPSLQDCLSTVRNSAEFTKLILEQSTNPGVTVKH